MELRGSSLNKFAMATNSLCSAVTDSPAHKESPGIRMPLSSQA